MVQRQCPLCEAHCGIRVHLGRSPGGGPDHGGDHGGEQVLRIDGDPADVLSRGYLCPKATALQHLHEDPARLRTPLHRVDGQLVPTTWTQAYAEIGARMRDLRRRHGRDAVGVYLGNPTAHSTAILAAEGLKKVLRSRNVFSAASVDQFPQFLASLQMFGDHTLLPVADVDRTDHLLVLGANPAVSNGSVTTMPDARGRIAAVRGRGGRVVVVDPRRTETARLATEHVSILPGGDPHLLLAMLHVILGEGLDRPPSWVDGLADVRRVVAAHPPDVAAPRCGVDAATITRLAREFAAAESAVAYGRLGVCHHQTGTVTHWLVNVLNAVTGNLDRPGGAMFPSPPVDLGRLLRTLWGPSSYDAFRSRGAHLPELVGELPVAAMADEMTRPGPRQLRGLLVVAGNPVVSAPDSDGLTPALEQLDLLVCVDLYLSETARTADFVLPPVSQLERSELDIVFPSLSVRNNVRASPRALAPPPGAQEDWDIVLRLAAELVPLGVARRVLRALVARVSAERVVAALVLTGPRGRLRHPRRGLTAAAVRRTPGGIDLGPLTPRLPGLLRTPGRRVRLAPALLLEAVADLADLAGPAGPAVQAPSSQEHDLQLIGRRHLRSNNSWMNRVPAMGKGRRRCTVLVHPDDAAARGLTDGQPVTVRSRVGEVSIALQVSDEVRPGVVSIPHGWGDGPGVNVNVLTDGALVDRLSGNAAVNATWVSLDPVTGAGSRPSRSEGARAASVR